MIGRCLFLVASLVPLVKAASPSRSLVNVRPDRTTTKFHVYVNLTCHEDWKYHAEVQLWEHNGFMDEKISEVVNVHQNGTTPRVVMIQGEMYNIDEPGEEFEPYLYFTYICGGDMWKETKYSFPLCFKEQRFCDYDLEVDLWSMPYQPNSPLGVIGKVFADTSNDERIAAIPYA